MRLAELDPGEVRARLRGAGIRFQAGPFVYHLQTPLGHVADALQFCYRDYSLTEQEELPDFHVRLWPPRGFRRWLRPQVYFSIDDGVVYAPQRRHMAVPIMEWAFNWCVASQAHQFLSIHGAVLERGGRAVIITGYPGAGKSTLCAALVSRGWRLLSDELTLVRPSDGRLIPVPRPISLKNQSIDLIRRFWPEACIGPTWNHTTKGEIAYVRPPREAVLRAEETAEPAWVIYVDYLPGAGTRSSLKPKGSAMIRLAEHGINYSLLGVKGFDTMARLIDRCDCYQFRYSDLAEAVDRFEQLPLPSDGHQSAVRADG